MKIKMDLMKSITIIITLLGVFISCTENPFDTSRESKPLPNNPPETYLFLFVNNSATGSSGAASAESANPGIDTTASRQVLHWWGEDRDGDVIGYYYQWDYQSKLIWTTRESDTFYVPIRTDYDEFTFRVWAVDDDSLKDPTPAVQTFPVFNSSPEIEFKLGSNPMVLDENPDVINYTFPTRTFFWDITDADGLETVSSVLWTLDDTTHWNIIERSGEGIPDHITVTGIEEGFHTFFVKARDIAGAESNIIFYPDSTNNMVPDSWYVNEPMGNVLLVDDFAQGQTDGSAQRFYADIISDISGAFSIWEIGNTSAWNPVNSQNALPYATADVEANLNYFDKVIWFSHLGPPSLSKAGLSITKYIKNGGRIFIANGNETFPDTTWTFTDIDSVYRINPAPIRLLTGIKINPFFTDNTLNELLGLEIGSENIYFNTISNKVSGLIPGPNADIIYRLEHGDSTGYSPDKIYAGEPIVGIKYDPDFISGECIYYSLPLHACDNKRNVSELIDYILNHEFED